MREAQVQVREFHLKVVKQPVAPAEPQLRNPELRARLIFEEAMETVEALVGGEMATGLAHSFQPRESKPDLIKAIDGIADIIFVALGTAEDIGVEMQPYWDEVVRANLTKVGAQVGQMPLGKAIKPPGWTPPDIAGVLANTSPPVRNSCGCDGAIDDGCYNCSPHKWACQKCGFPLIQLQGKIARSLSANGRACAHCAGVIYTAAQWTAISFSGNEPSADGAQ